MNTVSSVHRLALVTVANGLILFMEGGKHKITIEYVSILISRGSCERGEGGGVVGVGLTMVKDSMV